MRKNTLLLYTTNLTSCKKDIFDVNLISNLSVRSKRVDVNETFRSSVLSADSYHFNLYYNVKANSKVKAL